MTVVASVHLADVGAGTALGLLRSTPKVGAVEGLRHANVGLAAPLSASTLPSPTLRRVGLVSFWDDDEALDRFEAGHPVAEKLAGGWRIRLTPLRSFGTWPGLPDTVPHGRDADHEGAAVVLTLGRLRLTQAVRFLRTSAKAEGAVLTAPGVIFATGLARPPFVATCSVWESSRALMTYAYGRGEPAHADAIAAGNTKPFHHESAFIRFRPYNSRGSLGGKNPLPPLSVPLS
jgi:hypothetical protein